MIRLAVIFMFLAVASALSVVHLQYQMRKLVTLQEREQVHTHALEAEWTQLQLENSTWKPRRYASRKSHASAWAW